MFKLLSLPQPSIKKLPIFNKLLATFNFEDVNGLKEIGGCKAFSFNECTFTVRDIVAAYD